MVGTMSGTLAGMAVSVQVTLADKASRTAGSAPLGIVATATVSAGSDAVCTSPSTIRVGHVHQTNAPMPCQLNSLVGAPC